MKKHTLVTILLCAVTFKSQAQINVAATIGPQFPTGNFGNACNVGFGFTATGRYMVNPNFAVGLNLGYNHFGIKYADDASVNVKPVTALLEYYFKAKKVQPYIGGDIGFYTMTTKINDGLETLTSSKSYFGIAPTFGVHYKLQKGFSLTGNLKFNNVFSEGSNATWLGLNLGAAYSFKSKTHKTTNNHSKKPN